MGKSVPFLLEDFLLVPKRHKYVVLNQVQKQVLYNKNPKLNLAIDLDTYNFIERRAKKLDKSKSYIVRKYIVYAINAEKKARFEKVLEKRNIEKCDVCFRDRLNLITPEEEKDTQP